MLAHQLGHDLVLLLELGFQGLDLACLSVLLPGVGGSGFKGKGAVLKELFLPDVKECGLNLVLLANIGNGSFFKQMFAKNGQFLGSVKMPSFVGNGSLLLWAQSIGLTPIPVFSNSD